MVSKFTPSKNNSQSLARRNQIDVHIFEARNHCLTKKLNSIEQHFTGLHKRRNLMFFFQNFDKTINFDLKHFFGSVRARSVLKLIRAKNQYAQSERRISLRTNYRLSFHYDQLSYLIPVMKYWLSLFPQASR